VLTMLWALGVALCVGVLLVLVPSFVPVTNSLPLTVALGDTVPAERLFLVLNSAFPGVVSTLWGAWSGFVKGPLFA
jgi:hypothetical protein